VEADIITRVGLLGPYGMSVDRRSVKVLITLRSARSALQISTVA